MAGKCIYPEIRPGDTFGRLTVQEAAAPIIDREGFRRAAWLCRCDCGVEKVIVGTFLHNGNNRSCGRHRTGNLKHGWSRGPTRDVFLIWRQMISRCTNPKNASYVDYGGAGISVCPTWLTDFEAFMRDMGPRPSSRHSVERRDSRGNYEPDNCYWATYTQQNQNTSRNVYLEFGGERLCVAEVARRANINVMTLRNRLAAGLSLDEAISQPVGRWAGVRRRPDKGPDGRFM